MSSNGAHICSHRDRLERLAAAIDGTLDARERRRMREHLRACTWCRRLAAEAAALLAAHEARARPDRDQVSERAAASEPPFDSLSLAQGRRERSAPAPFDDAQGVVSVSRTTKRRARERVGESEGQSPSDEVRLPR